MALDPKLIFEYLNNSANPEDIEFDAEADLNSLFIDLIEDRIRRAEVVAAKKVLQGVQSIVINLDINEPELLDKELQKLNVNNLILG